MFKSQFSKNKKFAYFYTFLKISQKLTCSFKFETSTTGVIPIILIGENGIPATVGVPPVKLFVPVSAAEFPKPPPSCPRNGAKDWLTVSPSENMLELNCCCCCCCKTKFHSFYKMFLQQKFA